MKSKIDWPNHFVSLVFIVLSILMAFQLERCSADRKEDELVAEHLRNIVEETRFNVGSIERTIKKMEITQDKLDSLLLMITTGQDVVEINRLVFELLDASSLYLKETAYRSFTESGDIRFIDDIERKNEVVRLYEYYRLASYYNEMVTSTYSDRYFQHISEHLDLYRARPQALELYRERSFVNSIASYRYFTVGCLRNYAECRDYMKEFIEQNTEPNQLRS